MNASGLAVCLRSRVILLLFISISPLYPLNSSLISRTLEGRTNTLVESSIFSLESIFPIDV
jgi:hypothetical protein